jgi:hypothetical protein
MNAQYIIENAVENLIRKEFPFEDGRPVLKIGDWDDGEPEAWLIKIAQGKYVGQGRRLGYRIDDNGAAYPVLEA